MEKTGYKIEGGEKSEGVVIHVSFACETVEEALDLYTTTLPGGAKKGKKDKPAKETKPAKGGRKAKKDEEEEEDEEDDKDEDEDDEDEDDEDEEKDAESEDDEEDEDDEDDEDEDDEDEEDEKKSKKGKDKESKGGKGGKITVKITPALKKAEKLREVLVELKAQGVTDNKKLLEACKALQKTIPCLKSIKDLDVRVPRAASLLQEGKK